MLDNPNKKVGFILTSITLGHSTFACLTSCIIFAIIIYHLYYNRIKRQEKVTIFLCAEIYFFLLIFSTITVSMNIRTILGDLYGQSFDSSWCILSGYMALIGLCSMYMAFVNQAFYRLVRVVYYQKRWLQCLRLYMILTLIELLFACGLMCLLIPWNGVVYLDDDSFCYASFTNIRGILWAAGVAYILPFCCLLMIYIRITIFIRRQPNTHALVIRQRQDRDLSVIRRIFVIVSLLLLLGLPAMYFIVRFIITGDYHPLTSRISWFPVGISLVGLSVAVLFFIPQLKNIALKLLKPNGVAGEHGTLPRAFQMRVAIVTN